MGPGRRPRVFLDANVIFSGLRSSSGPPARIIDLLACGQIDAVISQQVLEESVRAFKEKLPKGLSALGALLEETPLEICRDPLPQDIDAWAKVIDPGDAAILAVAVAAQIDYLVTGDKHFYQNVAVSEKSGLRIVTPAEFLKELQTYADETP